MSEPAPATPEEYLRLVHRIAAEQSITVAQAARLLERQFPGLAASLTAAAKPA